MRKIKGLSLMCAKFHNFFLYGPGGDHSHFILIFPSFLKWSLLNVHILQTLKNIQTNAGLCYTLVKCLKNSGTGEKKDIKTFKTCTAYI